MKTWTLLCHQYLNEKFQTNLFPGMGEKWFHFNMIRAMRKCHVICEQQRHRSACVFTQSDQRFVVRCLDSIISLDSIAEISRLASFCGCTSRFVSGLVWNSQRHILSCRGSYELHYEFEAIKSRCFAYPSMRLNNVTLTWDILVSASTPSGFL